MRRRLIVPLTLATALALGACGSSGSAAKPGSTKAGSTPSTFQPASAVPSKSAKMVCSKEAQEDMASALGLHATRVTTPTWRDHTYSCTWIYPKGSFVLSVKELVSAETTIDFFNAAKKRLGAAQNLFGLGDGAFIAKNNGVVVRKDYKVLLIDVKNIPANFVPAMTRPDVATNIAAVVMSCWVGA
jgi:hypothetical protein